MAKTLRWPSSLGRQLLESRRRGVKGAVGAAAVLLACVAGLRHVVQNAGDSGVDLLWMCLLGLGIVTSFGFVAGVLSPTPREAFLARGRRGEELVARELDRLPDGWVVLNDVFVGVGGQIDHLVLGPNGVFCIETKHWNTAGVDAEGNWYRYKWRRWVPVEEKDNPAKQNIGHVMALKNFLRERGVWLTGIKSVVVLSDSNGLYNLMVRRVPPGGAEVCLLRELRPYLEGCSGPALSSRTVDRVVAAVLDRRGISEKKAGVRRPEL